MTQAIGVGQNPPHTGPVGPGICRHGGGVVVVVVLDEVVVVVGQFGGTQSVVVVVVGGGVVVVVVVGLTTSFSAGVQKITGLPTGTLVSTPN